jgi:hypothetical protein
VDVRSEGEYKVGTKSRKRLVSGELEQAAFWSLPVRARFWNPRPARSPGAARHGSAAPFARPRPHCITGRLVRRARRPRAGPGGERTILGELR